MPLIDLKNMLDGSMMPYFFAFNEGYLAASNNQSENDCHYIKSDITVCTKWEELAPVMHNQCRVWWQRGFEDYHKEKRSV